MFYVNLPAAVRIFRSSTLGLWAFDADRTLYVMVVMALLAFALFNAGLTAKLLRKWRSLRYKKTPFSLTERGLFYFCRRRVKRRTGRGTLPRLANAA